jgi:hypothetical protein
MTVEPKNGLQSYKEVCSYQSLPREQRQPSTLSPETWHTWNKLCGSIGWRHMDKLSKKRRWEEEHELTLDKLRSQEPLDVAPKPRAAIERTKQPASKETGASHLQAMRESIK